MCEFKYYKMIRLVELSPYVPGEILPDYVTITKADIDAGSPKAGDMIARNPSNPKIQWLINKRFFDENFEEM